MKHKKLFLLLLFLAILYGLTFIFGIQRTKALNEQQIRIAYKMAKASYYQDSTFYLIDNDWTEIFGNKFPDYNNYKNYWLSKFEYNVLFPCIIYVDYETKWDKKGVIIFWYIIDSKEITEISFWTT